MPLGRVGQCAQGSLVSGSGAVGAHAASPCLTRSRSFTRSRLPSPLTQALGTDAWVKDATLLAGLKPFAEDAAFRKR